MTLNVNNDAERAYARVASVCEPHPTDVLELYAATRRHVETMPEDRLRSDAIGVFLVLSWVLGHTDDAPTDGTRDTFDNATLRSELYATFDRFKAETQPGVRARLDAEGATLAWLLGVSKTHFAVPFPRQPLSAA